jgi:DnaJ-class molecular chaperone
VPRHELQTREAIKKAYMKTLLHIHPDKQSNADIDKKLMANSLFSLLRDSFNAFMSASR